MKKIKDPILLGIVCGLSGNTLKLISDTVIRKIFKTKLSYPQMAGGFFMSNRQTKSKLGNYVGLLSDAAVGAGLGVGFAYVLKFTGKDHVLMKGIGYGHGAWTILFGVANKLGASNIYPMEPKNVLSTYVTHTLYGIGAALAASTVGDPKFYKDEDIEKQ